MSILTVHAYCVAMLACSLWLALVFSTTKMKSASTKINNNSHLAILASFLHFDFLSMMSYLAIHEINSKHTFDRVFL